ncbi:cytoplasmic l-asparaginase i-like protein [Leishmania donovani]|uniref:asparaginase n=1 Tax=Leishmania donovani TaxID=5661 RepID=A0A3Q8IA09_LEIDO|nr:cytoplasmic l-asparaginase i-like protein [Leishmania donovani]AYU77455.1 cytoplasmic l-asparaginase i-like protein [Leishmania donovani]TPP47761.1 Asparaginase family protein [Leishmania donovani]CBZ32861.1 cytoplasmic l-asparaginase i-like protein [Leishmania donovani]
MEAGIEATATPAAVSRPPAAPRPGRNTRRILVLYLGGTIGMKKNAAGALEPVAGYLTEQMREMRELRESSEIAPFDIIEYAELLDSSDMNAADYCRIAADVQVHYDEYDGFLIAHGTDTMHYTASALSFLLCNLGKPVIVTGAMVALAEPYNDARRNVVIGMMIASNPKICEVCIFFNDSLFRGNRCNKVYHTYGAFRSLNYPALGVVGATDFVLKDEHLLPQPMGALKIMSDMRGRVGCYPIDPEADVDTFVALLEQKRPRSSPCAFSVTAAPSTDDSDGAQKPLLDAVLLSLNGVGSVQGVVAQQLRRIVAVAHKHNIVVCAVARDISGTLNPSEVQRLHAISPEIVYLNDMCASAAEVKLMYLFGKGLSPAKVAAAMTQNLRGEITPLLEVHAKL